MGALQLPPVPFEGRLQIVQCPSNRFRVQANKLMVHSTTHLRVRVNLSRVHLTDIWISPQNIKGTPKNVTGPRPYIKGPRQLSKGKTKNVPAWVLKCGGKGLDDDVESGKEVPCTAIIISGSTAVRAT